MGELECVSAGGVWSLVTPTGIMRPSTNLCERQCGVRFPTGAFARFFPLLFFFTRLSQCPHGPIRMCGLFTVNIAPTEIPTDQTHSHFEAVPSFHYILHPTRILQPYK
jgi:hypothetical protein